MDKKQLEIIAKLMEQLQMEMQPSKEDFAKRLGRDEELEPGVKVVKVEASSPEMEDEDVEGAEEMLGMDLDDDEEMGEDPSHVAKVLGAKVDPDEELKRRLMKLRS